MQNQRTHMANPIKFKLVASSWSPSNANEGFLIKNDWNDWFKFETLFRVFVFDESGSRIEIGYVKIGQFNMAEDQKSPNLPETFDELGPEFFSLGQDESYYEAIYGLKAELRTAVLKALRDVVADEDLWNRAKVESVTQSSLLREVTESTVEGQFRRLLQGGARLTPYRFVYAPPPYDDKSPTPPPLEFIVTPDFRPPSNVHVLIGRNGVGKTRMLNLMARAILGEPNSGEFTNSTVHRNSLPLANLVSVSFSAFDNFEPLPDRQEVATIQDISTNRINCSYVGLKRTKADSEKSQSPKSPAELAAEFVESFKVCRKGPRAVRWRKALEALEADPIFQEAGVASMATAEDAEKIFLRLSSGHKIVLLTITRLVEKVEEKTLVLLDEPEAHLHPPLLSAFVRSLSDLLINRNGVAIIATHSPVVLQEVPQCCVWKLRRSGREISIERPGMETFGENVGVLTREVFALEVTQSGFHKMLSDAAAREISFDAAVLHFNDALGAEARAILRAMFAEKSRKDQGPKP
jgi:predicted ATPase